MAELLAAAKYVVEELVNLESGGPDYPIDLMTHEEREGQGGDVIKIPSIGAMTVHADGSVDQTADDPSPNELKLLVDREPLILTYLRRRYEKQMLGGRGAWSRELALASRRNLKNHMAEDLFDYLMNEVAWDAAGTYWYNKDNAVTANSGDTLTYADFLGMKAKLMGMRGKTGNLQFWIDSYAESAVQNFQNFVGNNQQIVADANGQVGVRMIGTISGIPVFISSELPGTDARGYKTVDASASSISANVFSYTVPQNHGFVPGMRISTTGAGTTDIASPGETIASVTATTITTIDTGSGGTVADNGTPTIRLENGVNFLIDAGHVHVAGAKEVPDTDIVKREKSTGFNLQLSPLWGRIARQGRVLGLLSPRAALTF